MMYHHVCYSVLEHLIELDQMINRYIKLAVIVYLNI